MGGQISVFDLLNSKYFKINFRNFTKGYIIKMVKRFL